MHNNYFDCVKSRDDDAGETGDEWMVAGTLSIPKRPAMSSSSLDEMRPGVIKTEGALSFRAQLLHFILSCVFLIYILSLLFFFFTPYPENPHPKQQPSSPSLSIVLRLSHAHSNQLLLLLYHRHHRLSPLHSLLCLCILVVHDVAYKFRSIDRNRMLHC